MSSSIITDYIGVGLAAARPATPNLAPGAFGIYFATDTGALTIWNGSAWVGLSGSGTVTSVSGTGGITGTVTSAGSLELASVTDHAVTLGTGAAGALNTAAPGTAGQPLASNGASSDPSFQQVTMAGAISNYAVGSFTPTMNFGGAAVGLTYTKQNGFYVRIGKLVTIWFDLQINAKGSSTGSAFIAGLPYNVSTTMSQVGPPTWTTNSGSLDFLPWFGTAGGGSSTSFGLRQNVIGFTALTNSAVANGDEFAGTHSYFTDDT